ncbi:hypothetical protein BDV93DRAFT_604409, partial [Ceratobasidium sp. AG-I]
QLATRHRFLPLGFSLACISFVFVLASQHDLRLDVCAQSNPPFPCVRRLSNAHHNFSRILDLVSIFSFLPLGPL